MGECISSTSSTFVGWNEVLVSSDKGRREIHYYLKKEDGTSDLAVVGKKSVKRMSFHYAIQNTSLLYLSPSTAMLKLNCRKEVVDWLNSIAPGGNGVSKMDFASFSNIHLRKLPCSTEEFSWLGTPWTCRKKNKHYQSFCRNGVTISVHDFVYVLAEGDKRLVAYLEDMYEDSRSNKTVAVRWFHKIDEVGIVFPHNSNDREIFISLCLQDLSIECIDGLATVLCPKHFEIYVKDDASYTQLEPFVCRHQFENDKVKPFDITQLKGYWKQEIIRFLFTSHPSVAYLKSHPSNGPSKEQMDGDAAETMPKRRQLGNIFIASFSVSEAMKHAPDHLAVGSEVEVLSQDSGIRGCWFKAMVIRKHKNRVKVRYDDIRDAADEAKKLEEWIPASRTAIPDQLGFRVSGRTTLRPRPLLSNEGSGSWLFDVGTAVDVWWHDGWWEGVVFQIESEGKYHVYFPGEQKKSVFGVGDMRRSLEWLAGEWKHVNNRPDVVAQMVPKPALDGRDRQSPTNCAGCSDSHLDDGKEEVKERVALSDLLKDNLLFRLKWRSSRKRRRGSGSPLFCERSVIPPSLKVGRGNSKYTGSCLFGPSVAPPLTSLVMSI